MRDLKVFIAKIIQADISILVVTAPHFCGAYCATADIAAGRQL